MRRIPRWLIFTAVVVSLALASLTSLAVGTTRRSFPDLAGEITMPSLTGTVDVLRDEHGVPHIYAETAEDLFAAQGFVQAQDRFYEMDVRRHITAGRLAELFGASQVPTDTYVRTLGWRRSAEQEIKLLSANTRRYLDAYSAGVNSYLTGRPARDISLEYNLLALQGLRYRPESWTAVDSLSWLKAMAWDLGGNLNREVETAIMSAEVGERRAQELHPDYPLNGFDPILTRGDVDDGVFDPDARGGSSRPAPSGLGQTTLKKAESALQSLAQLDESLPPLVADRSMDSATGSNSWVLSGDRTATGQPMLANDPHLATSIPSVFAQVGLHCRVVTRACPFDVAGFGFAGMPGVVIGRNAASAWGLTTSNVDVQDLYLEQVEGDTVRIGEEYVPLEIRTEEIKVAGEETPRKVTVRSSRHGPLLSDASSQLSRVAASSGPAGDTYAVALAWTGAPANRTMDAIFAMDTASSFKDFRAAARLMTAPSQNLVYADAGGTIGYQLPGAIPRRGKGDGTTISPGWDRAYDWKGLIPFEQLPFLENPSSGVIVTANNQIIGRQYPHVLGSTYSYGWRSQEIIDTLDRSSRHSVADTERLQHNETVRFAAEIVPILLKINVRDAWVAEGQKTLVGWDYSTSADSAAAAYFFVLFHDILKRTFRDEMPEELWPAGGDRWFAVVTELMTDPDNTWWDDVQTKDVVERRDDILLAAMTDARKELTSLMSRDTSGWQWGRLHRVTLRNQTLGSSGIAPVERIFNRGDHPVGGGPAVVNAMGFDDRTGYRVRTGPAMRMVVDLGQPDSSAWVNQSGASGHAFHGNYDDQAKLWVTNQSWPFVFTRGAVEARTQHRLTLTPSG